MTTATASRIETNGTAKAAPKAAKASDVVVIQPANICRTTVRIRGTAPYVQHAFSQKSQAIIEAKHREGGQSKSKKARDARDFEAEAEAAKHYSSEGWVGIPATSFRCAMIDACRTAGMVMTRAKMCIFAVADGIDRVDGSPLVRLIAGDPVCPILPARNDSGVIDLRCRPMWHEWSASVTLEYDADMISADSVVNLLDRAGRQVGIGEGRPFSKNSSGMGWGTFVVALDDDE